MKAQLLIRRVEHQRNHTATGVQDVHRVMLGDPWVDGTDVLLPVSAEEAAVFEAAVGKHATITVEVAP